jgi:tetratricopeptide (TPR) repeat protein/S1-C subfamily serine protease
MKALASINLSSLVESGDSLSIIPEAPMYRSSLFLTAALIGNTIVLVQPAATAKSASEVKAIARAVTVEIKLQQKGTNGSGIIIQKQGNLYTLVTNRHVICGASDCIKIPINEVFTLELPDGQKYKVPKGSIKLLGSSDNVVDLAIIQFRSNRNHSVAKVAAPGSLKVEDDVYTAGFPFEQPGFALGGGKAIAVVNKRLTGDNGGYTIVYDAFTLPGMSGGGVFDGNGQLVAIHGSGDRFKENTDLNDKSKIDGKIGYNRGIPVRWLMQNLAEVGINLGTDRSISGIRAARSQVPATADEYFIAGFNKLVDPGDNVISGKRQAIQEFSTAIRLNPKYQYAYFTRAFTYEQVQEFQKSLADYNQSISINPKDSLAYNNRGLLKANKLNDIQGALADYNQSISINPKDYLAYNNRANLKYTKLNDIQGAFTDYNQAISINPKYSIIYYNRAILKENKLNNIQGALTDYNQAISINLKYSEAYNNRGLLKKNKLNDIQGALADYNQGIIINPKYSEAYNNRAILKADKLNDMQGALADYNQGIIINPKDAEAYYNRAILKANKLKDIKGALTDYNQAIIINPKNAEAYNNRAILKANKLKDIQGSIKDFRQAAKLFREQGNTQNYQLAIENLRQLGATE